MILFSGEAQQQGDRSEVSLNFRNLSPFERGSVQFGHTHSGKKMHSVRVSCGLSCEILKKLIVVEFIHSLVARVGPQYLPTYFFILFFCSSHACAHNHVL